ncbi:MAG TPA: protein kinase, partial [Myxococcales bacterium]|nr:protein kinase [Myxococcales bacterium]
MVPDAGARRPPRSRQALTEERATGAGRWTGASNARALWCHNRRIAASFPSLVGQQLGAYQLTSLLARGGLGALYRARTPPFRRDVAVKVIRADLAESPSFKAAFLEEGRTAALLHHANIVRVNEVGEDQGRLFLCTELVEGHDAGELLTGARRAKEGLPARFAVYVVRQVAQGLDHAHRLEVGGDPLKLVHGGVNPGNILLSEGGAVKLTGFGGARLRREAALEDAETRRHLAPEQLDRVGDARSDVFSLGAVLWELLTGRTLFEGKTGSELTEAVRHGDIAPPSRHASELPPALDATILKALRRPPDERYQTAGDFGVALTEIDLGMPVDGYELGRELERRFARGRPRASPSAQSVPEAAPQPTPAPSRKEAAPGPTPRSAGKASTLRPKPESSQPKAAASPHPSSSEQAASMPAALSPSPSIQEPEGSRNTPHPAVPDRPTPAKRENATRAVGVREGIYFDHSTVAHVPRPEPPTSRLAELAAVYATGEPISDPLPGVPSRSGEGHVIPVAPGLGSGHDASLSPSRSHGEAGPRNRWLAASLLVAVSVIALIVALVRPSRPAPPPPPTSAVAEAPMAPVGIPLSLPLIDPPPRSYASRAPPRIDPP